MAFYQEKFEDRIYLKSDKLNPVHGFTTRLGGVSTGLITGFNFGFRVNDNPDSVCENYRLMSCDLGVDLSKTVLSKQTHTDNIRIVTKDDWGKGIVKTSDISDTDALVTNIEGTALTVFSADCTPVLLYDKENRVIAAIHSGWRGTVKNISAKCVKLMREAFGSNPKNIIAAIGPCIGPCCFEFGPDAVDYFDKAYLKPTENGKYIVDIQSIISDSLLSCGLLSDNIDISDICTVCHSDMFYSYRKHKDKTGRQIAIIML